MFKLELCKGVGVTVKGFQWKPQNSLRPFKKVCLNAVQETPCKGLQIESPML